MNSRVAPAWEGYSKFNRKYELNISARAVTGESVVKRISRLTAILIQLER
jgi:hypothetical protein